MLWRKKTDGFEWHKYVRTTIKLRREDRRRRLDDVKDVALGGIKDAGRAGLAASSSGLDAVNRTITFPIAWIGGLIAGALHGTSTLAARLLAPVGRIVERPGRASMLGFVAVLVGLLGLGRVYGQGWDELAIGMVAGAGVLLGALILPPVFAGRGPATLVAIRARLTALGKRIPTIPGLSPAAQRAVTAAVIAVLAIGMGWLLVGVVVKSLPGATVASIPGFSRPVLEGSASAVRGDVLRIAGKAIKLAGIEAPEPEQQCGGRGTERRWKCGAAARQALGEMVRTVVVRCEVSASFGSGGQQVATCKSGATDIAAELVSRGHVFAESGLFSSYGRLEQDARNAKLGIWRGTAERPTEYRTRIWETAKKAAPDGCPIKGRVSGNERHYLMPWTPSYAEVKVRQERGGRWFCSEAEAQAAGWRLTDRS